MTQAFRQGFMDKLAAIKSPQDLDAFYKKLKYRVLNKDTNRPYFNTNFETFENWHLLSPEQIKKHKIGICYDTAAMTDKVLNDLGVEHSNYFAHSDSADGWENDPTHAFNVYKDENGDWRWIEGSWGPYKGNNWKERRRKDLVKKIVKALAEASGQKQKLHEVAEFPEPGIGMKDWYAEMLKNPVKKAAFEKKAGPSLRDKANAGVPGAKAKLEAQEAAKAQRVANPNPLGSLNEQKAYIKQQGQKNLAKLTPEQQEQFWQDANEFQANAARFRALAGSLMPGIGLAGAAGIIGTGEGLASGIEGKDFNEATENAAKAGLLTYAGGKVLQAAGKYVLAPTYRWTSEAVRNNVINPAVNAAIKLRNRHFPMTDSALAESIRAPAKGDVSPTFLRRRLYEAVSNLESPGLGKTPAERLELLRRLGKADFEALKASRAPLTAHEKLQAVRDGEKYLRDFYPDVALAFSHRAGPYRQVGPIVAKFDSLDDVARSLGVDESSVSHIFKGGPSLAKFEPDRPGFFSGNFRVAGKHTGKRQYLMAADLGRGPFADAVVARETPHLTTFQQRLDDPVFAAHAREEFAKRLAEIKAGRRSIPEGWATFPDWEIHYAPNYEVLLKGKEVADLPWRYFLKMPDGSFVERTAPLRYPSRLSESQGTLSRDMLGQHAAQHLMYQAEGTGL